MNKQKRYMLIEPKLSVINASSGYGMDEHGVWVLHSADKIPKSELDYRKRRQEILKVKKALPDCNVVMFIGTCTGALMSLLKHKRRIK
jgi:hypothetical protein